MSRIWKRLKSGARTALGTRPAGRNLSVFPDDVFIVSYPRSGNTWTRFLVGNLVYQNEPVTFANVESRIPEIYFYPDRKLRGFARPRILKSHEYFDPRYNKVLYIVRDPRDVAVSMYHYSIKRKNIPDGFEMEEFVPRFMAGEFLEDWGIWDEHVSSWYATRQGKNGFLLLRYEDMLSDPAAALTKVAAFMNLDVGDGVLARAVQLSSSEQMRELEKRQSSLWTLTKDTRPDIAFVRKARSGTWESELPPAAVQRIERAWAPLMRTLGYNLAPIDGGAVRGQLDLVPDRDPQDASR
jgi:hypothetical protein